MRSINIFLVLIAASLYALLENLVGIMIAVLTLVTLMPLLCLRIFFDGEETDDAKQRDIFANIARRIDWGTAQEALGRLFLRVLCFGGWVLMRGDGTLRRFTGKDAEQRARALFENYRDWLRMFDGNGKMVEDRTTSLTVPAPPSAGAEFMVYVRRHNGDGEWSADFSDGKMGIIDRHEARFGTILTDEMLKRIREIAEQPNKEDNMNTGLRMDVGECWCCGAMLTASAEKNEEGELVVFDDVDVTCPDCGATSVTGVDDGELSLSPGACKHGVDEGEKCEGCETGCETDDIKTEGP